MDKRKLRYKKHDYHDDGADWREWFPDLMPKDAASQAIEGLPFADDLVMMPKMGNYLEARWEEGMNVHGPRFLGCPLKHLEEELADGIRYSQMGNKLADIPMMGPQLSALLYSLMHVHRTASCPCRQDAERTTEWKGK